MTKRILTFPEGFLWGAATSSYQIEGAYAEDGKGESIWDRFSKTPGKVYQGHNGDVACDHYHRFRGDVKMMADLGLKSYRFSIAWPRIFPQGKGDKNEKGIDFYNKLVDSLLANNIQPFITLYHWDLPQTLQQKGGWANRDTAYYFRDYAGEMASRLGDRVSHWITHNEPAVTTFQAHYDGIHAPGIKDLKTALQVAHHLLLSHGLAVPVIRANIDDGEVGISLNLYPSYPASDSIDDIQAAKRNFDYYCGWFLEPIFNAHYPEEIEAIYQQNGLLPAVQPEDLKIAAVQTDFLGLNYYTRNLVRHSASNNIWGFKTTKPEKAEYTGMGWEVFPEGLFELLKQLTENYQPPKIYITENGATFQDKISKDGKVHDPRRIDYLHHHFVWAHRAIQAGVPLAGYFVWSLMDDFEWAEGYSKRFGMVYVHYDTQERIYKDSAEWYQAVIEQNGVLDV